MKNKFLFFIVFTLLFTKIFAQQEINTSIKTQMNATFGNLDKTKIPHGLLLDYGMEFTNVPAYNGTITDSTYTDANSMSQIYKTLLSSRIRDVSDGFVMPTEYDTRWKNNRSSNHIAIGGIYFKYSQIMDNPIASNKLTLNNGVVYDKYINGVWQNPYQELQTFAMTPAIKKYEGLNLKVKIPSGIFYSNYTTQVQSIQIDFGNGSGYVTVPFDQTLPINYTSVGVKVWKYKLNLSNGTSLYNQSRIKLFATPATLPYNPNNSSAKIIPGNPPQAQMFLYTKKITATKPYAGSSGIVNLTIDLAAGRTQITKPLIVAEGFDLGIIFSPENLNGMNTYTDFKTSVFEGGSNLRSLIYNSNKQYDIIYVDWSNGADYLQRNAYALEAVINWVNSVKVGVEPNVVLGQSMGGVIGRYALSDMEQDGVDHKTRLFISHDAPQQGANIPVSLQFMYRHLTNQYAQVGTTLFGGLVTVPILENNFGVSNYISILDAPASRQLLSNWSNSNYGIDNSLFNSFYDELKSKGLPNRGGYPINTRNIAISDGAECGSTQGFNPNDDLVNYNWNKSLTLGGDLLSMIYLPLGGSIGGLFLDQDFFGVGIVGLIPGKSTYNVEFNAKAMPYGTGNQIYKGKVSYTKKIFWLWPKITVNITNVQKNQPSNILPIDAYGGGYYNTSIAAGTLDVPNLYVRDKFNFIPTTSALDIGKRNVILTDTDYKRPYVGGTPPTAPQNSPFANFATSFDRYNPNSSNQKHISFDNRNGDWLAQELNLAPIVTNCSYLCSSTQISGDSNFCSSGAYSLPQGASSYYWTISGGNGIVISGNGTPNITLTNTTNYNGSIVLSAALGDTTGKCGQIAFTKTIWVGYPTANVMQSYEPKPYNESHFYLDSDDLDPTQGVTSIQWAKLSSTPSSAYVVLYATPGSTSGFARGSNQNWSLEGKVDITNACGTTTKYFTLTPDDAAPEDYLLTKVENANTYSVFKKSENSNTTAQTEQYQIKVANNLGTIVISKTANSFNVQSLPTGTYIVNVSKAGKTIINQTIIKN